MIAANEMNREAEPASTEVELSADDLLALAKVPSIGEPESAPVASASASVHTAPASRSAESRPASSQMRAARAPSTRRVMWRIALALGLTTAAIVGGVPLYQYGSSRGAHPSSMPISPQRWIGVDSSASDEEPEGEPVRFANPFDASEVFEFPPGTNEAEARDAVRRMLVERAMERQS
jgi:hypothetical protein